MTGPAAALSCLNRTGDLAPFFCVPGAATTPLSLHPLSRQLAPNRPFFSFRYAGVDDDSPLETTIEAMSMRLVEAMLAAHPSGPYLLGGYCLGGLVALDAAVALRERGASVPVIALLESIPPLGARGSGSDRNARVEAVDSASLNQALAAMEQNAVRQMDKLPPAIAETLRRTRSIHNHAGADYVPRQTDAPIVLLRTTSHGASLFDSWAMLTSSGFTMETVDGDTQSILSKPDVVMLGEKLQAALATATRHTGTVPPAAG